MKLDPQLANILAAPEDRETCKDCGSIHCTFNRSFGYWTCDNCLSVWAYDEDDPDYDELIEEV